MLMVGIVMVVVIVVVIGVGRYFSIMRVVFVLIMVLVFLISWWVVLLCFCMW